MQFTYFICFRYRKVQMMLLRSVFPWLRYVNQTFCILFSSA